MTHADAATTIVFCPGLFDPRGAASVAVEWRDFMTGLEELGLPPRIVDPMDGAFIERFLGVLALGRAIWELFGARAASSWYADLGDLSSDGANGLTGELQQWLDGDLEGPPELLRRWGLSGDDLERLRNELERHWDGVLDISQTRIEPRAHQEALEIEAFFASPSPGAGSVVVVADFYDVWSWGPIWRYFLHRAVSEVVGACCTVSMAVRSMCEGDRVETGKLALLNAFDAVWVPSRFHLPIFERGGVCRAPVCVVPQSFDERLFRPEAVPALLPKRRSFAFLMIWNYSPSPSGEPDWTGVRKAIDVSLDAFLREFREDEDVCVVLKSAHEAEETDALVARTLAERGHSGARAAQIVVLPALIKSLLPNLYTACNVLLGVSRGEGWGRPLMEAMACGVPVIANAFGGNVEFMSRQNSFLVRFRKRRITSYLPQLSSWGRLGDPDVGHLRRTLRRAYSSSSNLAGLGQEVSREMHAKYNRKAVAQIIAGHAALIARQKARTQ